MKRISRLLLFTVAAGTEVGLWGIFRESSVRLRRGTDGIPDGYVQEPVFIGPLCAKIPDFNFTEQ